MDESTPQFDNSTRLSPGRLVLGRDVNKTIDNALSGILAHLPPEMSADDFGFKGQGFARVFVVNVTGEETGKGKYAGVAYLPHSGDLSDPDADFAGDNWRGDVIQENILFVNLDEYGSATHDLPIDGSAYCLALLVDHTDDDRMVLIGTCFAFENC